MLSLRARLFIIISLVILLVLGISIFLIVRSRGTTPENVAPTTTGTNLPGGNNTYNPIIETPVPGGVVPQGVPIKPATTLEIEQNAVRQFAKIFIERYNSYSTDSNFQNIIEVKELVTPDLWKTLSAKIGKTMTGQFMGVTTKVVSSELTDWSDKAATVLLSTSITEEKNNNISNRQQKVTVDLVKSGDTWLVNKFQWQ